jgi:hypothetical protein
MDTQHNEAEETQDYKSPIPVKRRSKYDFELLVWGLIVLSVVIPWAIYIVGFPLVSFCAALGLLFGWVRIGYVTAHEKFFLWLTVGIINNLVLICLSFKGMVKAL